jgi:NAD(P)-dependent dehydrogenase (short-subunit alcohol dehydrogenase family)
VLVTGASGGIGAAVAARLAEAGAKVAALDRAGAPPTAAALSIECDVSRPAEVTRAFERVTEELGGLDAVIHCAGITSDRVLWKMDDHSWQQVVDVNLSSAFYLLRAATPLLRERGGAVVMVTSINGERGKFGQANYAASKAGLMGLAKTAARELGRFGVRVNCVAPGLIETRMTADLPEDARARALDETLLGRLGKPEDVANAILFLCSDLSRHVTGQTLRVDGGQLIA